ncbi:Type 1 glutamine amidotransferase-like domain-containing protein [Porphyromonas sp.]|uniref:Type 1 glutamine amidotransferase-like domain-containing protein n=1 Tax=Porphyromonas sp. TaxID=1924944 RepID=UPI0026DDBBD1|nr:Type 1 glutamine amidotransferase-like domain-containing protein [Porphyromonas sp.]MDO4695641.1 Type 1 glutamine amidotransferase-like domain-containing protein [Porphyromonas sp.]MDO4771537.1 Type 1 glutamine amidotransferase-like domain-containing protein [Porphyromonas sp.]
MRKIFLCSSFSDVAPLFNNFVMGDLRGNVVTFIPTASLTEKVRFYVKAGRKALEKMGCVIDELDVSTATGEDVEAKLRANDLIYITGGNTFFLLQELQKSGADKIIKEQISSGKIYVGESAGAMILSPYLEYATLMDSTEYALELTSFSGLGVVDFYTVPHHTNFPFIRVVEEILSKYQDALDLCPISNSQAICVENESVRVQSM